MKNKIKTQEWYIIPKDDGDAMVVLSMPDQFFVVHDYDKKKVRDLVSFVVLALNNKLRSLILEGRSERMLPSLKKEIARYK